MDMNMQAEAVQPQAAQQISSPEAAVERQGGPTSVTSLLEIKDQVDLSPEGRALLERLGEADA